MDAIDVKTIHFTCPRCHQPVEAWAEVSGKLISCPGCGREFNAPGPAPKASSSWLVVFGLGLFLSLTALGTVAIQMVGARSSGSESLFQSLARQQSEARVELAKQCNKAIVGLSRIIEQDLNLNAGSPDAWTAEVTADFVNPVGGVERTTVPFVFKSYHSDMDGRDHVLCSKDLAKISRAESEALKRRFGLNAPTRLAGK